MSAPEVLYTVSTQVATITLNRPGKLNAWTVTMYDALRNAFEEGARDENVRVIVVTGAGRGFCAGADLGRLSQVLDGTATHADPPQAENNSRPEFGLERTLSYPLAIPKPVIAAINGVAVGMGLCFALYCDIRFMSASAMLSTAFSRLGLIAEYGSAWMLQRLIGPMNACDLLYSARHVDATEAAAMGLVRVLPAEGFMEQVYGYAHELASRCSPRSLGVIKRQIAGALNKTLAESSVEANLEMLASLQSADFREGVAAYFGKRAPMFPGR
ncbi:MAG: enoyl-CoA hydratase-related protein [Steroidobacteraceae bacterium]